MRPILYAHTLNLLAPRGWPAGVCVLVFLLGLFSIATNTRLEAHLASFFSLIVMAAILVGSMLLLIEQAPLSFCLPNQQRVLRPIVMLVGLGSCIGITALTLKVMALNRDHALYAEFFAGPVFRLLLLQGLALYFLVLSLLLAVTSSTAVNRRVANVTLVVLLLGLLFYGDLGNIQSLALAAIGAGASAALCWGLLGLRSVARQACQGASVRVAPFQLNSWHGGTFESLMISGIRRFGGDPWRGAFFESLYFALNGATARNILLALFGCLYITVSLVLNFRDTQSVRLYDFVVLPLLPLCVPIFRMQTMFNPWLPVSRVQRFVRLLLKGAFHYLLALLMVLLVRALLGLLAWGFPDAIWYHDAKAAVDLPLKILFLCGLFALVANFCHAVVRSTIAAVIFTLFIGVFCYNAARTLVPSFLALAPVGIVFLSILACVPFVSACAFHSFRADLREGKQAWTG